MKIRNALLMALFVVPLASYAQTFKCRTPSGKMEFSDLPCAGGSQTERIQSNEYISLERQRQAREVQARSAAHLQGIEAENAAFQQQQQRQQAAQMQSDANQRLIESRRTSEKARLEAAIKRADCIETANSRRNSAMLAECKGISRTEAQNELDDALTDKQPAPANIKQTPVVKSCYGTSCRDQLGNRYITEAGKTVRSDGARCYQRGKVMYCNEP